MSVCLHCEIQTSNPKFCSKSCAASYNNKKVPKRHKVKKLYICASCQKQIVNNRPWRIKYCDACRPCNLNWNNITIQQTVETATNKASTYRRIRDNSRNKYLASSKPKKCIRCGYSAHFEVSHIIPISKFAKDTPIAVVNALDNLVALCPNCHWEFHNGLFEL